MAVPFASNIELLSTLPNFSRDMFNTKAEMKVFAEYKLPDVFITTCKEDGNVYVFNRKNEVDPDTGKWRAINASGSTSYEALKDKPAIDGKVLSKDSTLDELGIYDKISIDGFLDNKVDKVEGKDLSDNNFSDELKEKLEGVETGANANVQADWNEEDSTVDSFIKNKPELFSGDYKDLINKPINLSDFNNDSDFITSLTNNLKNYYLKTETYTQSEIDSKIGAIATLSMLIVDELPEEGSSKIIYLLPKTGTKGYLQYIYTLGDWANIGDTDVDLAEYVKKDELSDVATTGSYKDLIDKPQIPEKTSELINDSNFIVINDEEKSADTTYSSQKIESLIAGSSGSALEREVVSSVDIGGIKEGDTLTVGTTLTDFVSKLLEKYVAPVISISISPSDTLYEKGDSIDSVTITASVTKKSENIEKVEFLVNGTVKETVESGVSAGGSFSFTYDEGVTSNTTFRVRTNDIDTKTSKYADKSVSFVLPYYYGVVPNDSIAVLTNLTKDLSSKGTKTYTYTADNEHCVIVFDSAYADLVSIKDQNNFENINDFTKKTINIGDYTYKYYITKGKKTISNFKFTFA